jgi:hypothetical protein
LRHDGRFLFRSALHGEELLWGRYCHSVTSLNSRLISTITFDEIDMSPIGSSPSFQGGFQALIKINWKALQSDAIGQMRERLVWQGQGGLRLGWAGSGKPGGPIEQCRHGSISRLIRKRKAQLREARLRSGQHRVALCRLGRSVPAGRGVAWGASGDLRHNGAAVLRPLRFSGHAS